MGRLHILAFEDTQSPLIGAAKFSPSCGYRSWILLRVVSVERVDRLELGFGGGTPGILFLARYRRVRIVNSVPNRNS